jgi:hypothetical protein
VTRVAPPACVNCGIPIPSGRRGDYFAKSGESKSTLVCCMACGNELAHRLVRAVPGVVDLLPPADRSRWRAYKANAPSRTKPR